MSGKEGHAHSPRSQASVRRAAREAEALQMRVEGVGLQKIAEHFGKTHPEQAARMIERAMSRVPAENAAALRNRSLERLELVWRTVAEGMVREHAAVSFGKLVTRTDPDTGEDVVVRDWGPNYQAARIGVQVIERICKIIGADAPTKRQVEVITEDMLTSKIRELEAELDAAPGADRSVTGNGSSPS